MTPWWRPEPLTESESDLLDLTLHAHAESARRNNVSSVVAVSAFQGSRSFTSAISAALNTVGEVHGPIVQAYRYLVSSERPDVTVAIKLPRGERLPGWGNAFVRRQHDPLWTDVRDRIMDDDGLSSRILHTTAALHGAGKFVMPNAACWTAAVAITLRIPPELSPWLFVAGRLSMWSERMMKEGMKC